MRIQNRNPDFLNAVYVPIKLCKVERMNLCWGEQADVDDFTKLGVDPPGQEHNSFLSANFGHSAFKPLQWRFVNFSLLNNWITSPSYLLCYLCRVVSSVSDLDSLKLDPGIFLNQDPCCC
jgi:hypothetical protein